MPGTTLGQERGADREQARRAVLVALATPDSGLLPGPVRTLVGLQPTDDERTQARAVIQASLPTADPDVAPALVSLAVTRAERAQARDVILAALPDQTRGTFRGW